MRERLPFEGLSFGTIPEYSSSFLNCSERLAAPLRSYRLAATGWTYCPLRDRVLICSANVATMGILYGTGDVSVYASLASAFSTVAGMSFLVFNLLCAPCFAAMGAIKREMNNTKWFWIAIGYQCGYAYLVGLVINQIAGLITGDTAFNVFTVIAILIIVGFIYLLFRPYKESKTLKVDSKKLLNATK